MMPTGLGKFAQPLGQAGPLLFPGQCPAAGGVRIAARRKAGFGHDSLEREPPQSRPGKSLIATESELLEPGGQQMPHRQPHDRFVVGLDHRQIGQQPGGTDVDRRQAGLPHRLGNPRVFDPGDDAVAPPLRQVRRGRAAATLFRQIDRPRPVLAQVAMDSAQQTPCVGVGRLDQQRHARTFWPCLYRKLRQSAAEPPVSALRCARLPLLRPR